MAVALSQARRKLARQLRQLPSKDKLEMLITAIEGHKAACLLPTNEAEGYNRAAAIMNIGDKQELIYIAAKAYVADYERRFNVPTQLQLERKAGITR